MARKSGGTIMVNREEFAAKLLEELKSVYLKICREEKYLNENAAGIMESTFNENLPEIQADIDEFKSNNEHLGHTGSEVTKEINAWYGFTMNKDELGSILFPLKFTMRLRKARKNIMDLNNNAQSCTIRNRFIKEQIKTWATEVERKNMQKIKDSIEYQQYCSLVDKKDRIISELKYLLSTIPSVCPAFIEPGNFDEVIANLRNKAV
jgi:hypothetical protein